MDLVKVRLTKAAADNGATSTFHFENHKYFLSGRNILPVPRVVANAWVSADSNVQIEPER